MPTTTSRMSPNYSATAWNEVKERVTRPDGSVRTSPKCNWMAITHVDEKNLNHQNVPRIGRSLSGGPRLASSSQRSSSQKSNVSKASHNSAPNAGRNSSISPSPLSCSPPSAATKISKPLSSRGASNNPSASSSKGGIPSIGKIGKENKVTPRSTPRSMENDGTPRSTGCTPRSTDGKPPPHRGSPSYIPHQYSNVYLPSGMTRDHLGAPKLVAPEPVRFNPLAILEKEIKMINWDSSQSSQPDSTDELFDDEFEDPRFHVSRQPSDCSRATDDPEANLFDRMDALNLN